MFLKIFLLLNEIIVFSESGLVGYGVTFRIGRIPVQTPLAARPGFGRNLVIRLPVTFVSGNYQTH